MSRIELASRISDALQDREAEGRARALRALLVRPVLRAETDPELFRLVRRQAETLRAWFERETGWRLVVESQTVRLAVSYVPAGPTAAAVAGSTTPLEPAGAIPGFTRRRYVLLCLSLAVLERSDPQVSLGRLAEQVVLAARQPGLESVEFTLGNREERADLVAAIRLLLGYGVLSRVAGDRGLLRLLGRRRALRRRPAGAGHDALHGARPRAGGVGARAGTGHRAHRVRAARVAADVHRGRNQPAAAARRDPPAAVRPGGLLRRAARGRTELPAQRAAGPGDPSDRRGHRPGARAPGRGHRHRRPRRPPHGRTDAQQGTDGHATLLLAEHLSGAGPTEVAVLRRKVRALAKDHAAYWRKTTREPVRRTPSWPRRSTDLSGRGWCESRELRRRRSCTSCRRCDASAVAAPRITERTTR